MDKNLKKSEIILEKNGNNLSLETIRLFVRLFKKAEVENLFFQNLSSKNPTK